MYRTGAVNLLYSLVFLIIVVLFPMGSSHAQNTQRESAKDGSAHANSPQDSSRVSNDEPLYSVSKKPTLAALMSLAIPGSGQFYTESYFKAVIFFGVDVGMWYGIYVQNQRYQDHQDRIKELSGDKYATLRRQEIRLADFYKNDRNRLLWWTAGLTLLATFDAYVDAHLYDFEIDPTVGATPSGDGPAAGIRITF